MVAPVFTLKCFSHIYVKTLKITPRSHQTYPFPCPPRSGNRRVCIIPSPFASLWSYSATVTKTVLAKCRLLAARLLSKAKQNKTKLRIKIWSQFQCYDTAPALSIDWAPVASLLFYLLFLSLSFSTLFASSISGLLFRLQCGVSRVVSVMPPSRAGSDQVKWCLLLC